MKERLYYTPAEFSGMTDSAAIQAAVNAAHETDIRMVMIPGKENGMPWQLNTPVRLPNDITVVLDGAVVKSAGVAFMNMSAEDPETKSLAGEQYGLFLLGRNGAKLIGEGAPQLLLDNVRNYFVAGLCFEGGFGIRLRHCRYGKLQRLTFADSVSGICLEEGCNDNLMEDIQGSTIQELIKWDGGDTTIWGRGADMYNTSVCRVKGKTQGAPVISFRGNCVEVSNINLRDITDETEQNGVSVALCGGVDKEVRDVTVRNVSSCRIAVEIGENCDGVYLNGIQGQDPRICQDATRVLVEKDTEAVCLPVFPADDNAPYITPNDPQYFGSNDAETIQNAVNAAAAAGVKLVIPRQNLRTGTMQWDIQQAIKLPSDITLELWCAHLRMEDFTYDNMFVNAEPENKNITIRGIGCALLDSGKPNGLKLKNAGTMGFGSITDNAMMLFCNVEGLRISDLTIKQTRWYGIYCAYCKAGQISNIHLEASPIFPDLGGIQLRSGCQDFLVENLTGLSGEDMVILGANALDDRTCTPAPEKSKEIRNIHIRSIMANVSRCTMVNLFSHDDRSVSDICIENLLDNSLAEQKKQPAATVRIGQSGGYCQKQGGIEQLRNITVRDINGRGSATVELGGCSKNVTISNIHSFGTTEYGLKTAVSPEASDYLLASISADPQSQNGNKTDVFARVESCRINGVFFRCMQGSRYMRGTATSIITDKKKYIGCIMGFNRLYTRDFLVENVLADRVGKGIRLTGEADVRIKNLQIAEVGQEFALSGEGCMLCIDEEIVPVTKTQKL